MDIQELYWHMKMPSSPGCGAVITLPLGRPPQLVPSRTQCGLGDDLCKSCREKKNGIDKTN